MMPEVSDAKKVFRQKGTCSRTFFYLLDREFDHLDDTEERASDSLAGGILQRGQQCGMLWGSALAVGAEAYRRCESVDLAMRVAVKATQNVMASFSAREHTLDCMEITQCDFRDKWSFAKYLLSGRFLECFKMAEQWAPEAIQAALKGLDREALSSEDCGDSAYCLVNCASEVARKLGASEKEMVMVAGFAGGMGLSGGGCGALSAAIWMRSLHWCRENKGSSSFKNPAAIAAVEAFEEVTQGEFNCSELTGQPFTSIDQHSNFILQGGCSELIQALAGAERLESITLH